MVVGAPSRERVAPPRPNLPAHPRPGTPYYDSHLFYFNFDIGVTMFIATFHCPTRLSMTI